MAKTAAERQRERRARLKADPSAYGKYKEKDRNRKKHQRDEMTPSEKQKLRKRVREAVRNYRQRHISTENSPPDVSAPVTQVYRSAASLGKAKRKVFKALPKSPSKRAALLKTLASETLDAYFVPAQVHGRRIDANVQKKVIDFYQSDSVSRAMPGKADYVTLRNDTGDKTRAQKRHLFLTLAETYQAFKADNQEMVIGKSSFIAMRPKWVLLSSQMPQNVCGCQYHSNVILLLEALHRKFPDLIPLYSREDFLSKCVCSLQGDACMSDNCDICCDGKLFKVNFATKVEGRTHEFLKWFQWVQQKDKFIQKKETEGTVGEALLALQNLLPQFLWHCFVKANQATAYAMDKTAVNSQDSSTCLLQMDFAENFTCSWQDEIQSAHWRQRQVSLYTAMVYHRERILSYVIASDSTDHDKNAVAAFTSKLLEIITTELPTANAVHVWTDGPSSQFKNKFVFALLPHLQDKYSLELTWNFFATSHGKGPNDALGGVVKRMVYRKVMTRQAIVNNSIAFADACNGPNISATVLVMNKEAIRHQVDTLQTEAVWNGLKGFQGTMSTHWVKPWPREIETKFHTLAEESKFRPIVSQETVAPNDLLVSTEIMKNTEESRREDSDRDAAKNVPTPAMPSTSGRKNQRQYVCPKCKWAYGDKEDPKCEDDWVRCSICKSWFHLTCAEGDGIIDDDDVFNCFKCL